MFRRPRSIALLLLLSAPLAACGSNRTGGRAEGANQTPAAIFSPNGEPLNGGPLGNPSCREASDGWFRRTDTNHDGTIDRGEYLADTRRQFAVMDLDRDGEVTPTELSRYRAPYNAVPAAQPVETAAPTHILPRGTAGAAARGPAGGADATTLRAQQFRQNGDVSQDVPDPVMSADTRLRFRVSLADFLRYQTEQFDALDTRHDGHLTPAEIQSLCPRRR